MVGADERYLPLWIPIRSSQLCLHLLAHVRTTFEDEIGTPLVQRIDGAEQLIAQLLATRDRRKAHGTNR